MLSYYLGNNLRNDKGDAIIDMVNYKGLKELLTTFFWPNVTKWEKRINNLEMIDVEMDSWRGQRATEFHAFHLITLNHRLLPSGMISQYRTRKCFKNKGVCYSYGFQDRPVSVNFFFTSSLPNINRNVFLYYVVHSHFSF